MACRKLEIWITKNLTRFLLLVAAVALLLEWMAFILLDLECSTEQKAVGFAICSESDANLDKIKMFILCTAIIQLVLSMMIFVLPCYRLGLLFNIAYFSIAICVGINFEWVEWPMLNRVTCTVIKNVTIIEKGMCTYKNYGKLHQTLVLTLCTYVFIIFVYVRNLCSREPEEAETGTAEDSNDHSDVYLISNEDDPPMPRARLQEDSL